MNSALTIQSHAIRDIKLEGWKETIAGKWHYRDLSADPRWRHGWISFDAVTYNPKDQCVYCGLNSIDGDLLYRFDPKTSNFVSLNTQRWTGPFDSKIHRTLLLSSKDECFYFATSLLHDADQQTEAEGGKLVRYDWKHNRFEVLGIPFPHLYLQSIAMDSTRDILYAYTYPAEFLLRYDLQSGRVRNLAYVGNAIMFAQPHNSVIDRDGWLWGTYAETRAWDECLSQFPIRLFKYHPDEERFVWFEYGLSRKADWDQLCADSDFGSSEMPDMTESRHKEDYGFCDSMSYDGDKYIYAGSVAGVLSRIEIATGKVEKVSNIMKSGRLPALSFGPDGFLYGGGGMKGRTALFRLNPKTFGLDVWNDLVDRESGERPARIHELCIGEDHTMYFAENDNHKRSSYLWSAKLGER